MHSLFRDLCHQARGWQPPRIAEGDARGGTTTMLSRRQLLPALATLAAATPLTRRAALAFPDKPITLVTGYSPGGSTDIAARILAERLAANLGEGAARIVVEN